MTYKSIFEHSNAGPVLTAQSDASGFFALSNLKNFVCSELEPYAQLGDQTPVVLDFTQVRMWDIAALLWLVVALHHYKHNTDLTFKLCLPEGRYAECDANREKYDKSADFLRRWRFDLALANIVCNPDTILVTEQEGYFNSGEPKRFYKANKLPDDRGLLQSLVSRRLVQIQNLADQGVGSQATVTAERITDCVTRFQSERMGDVLHAQCGIEKRKGDLFADHLLTEAVMNVHEHPKATIGMVAISVLPPNELILAVVDNGDSIPKTLWPRYHRDHKDNGKLDLSVMETYKRDQLTSQMRADVTAYATKAGVTRKDISESNENKLPGMGLTYIKEDAIDTFKGKLRILTDSICLEYKDSSSADPKFEEWQHPWRGNLLRISIPLVPCKKA